jgi:glycerol-3-phosphate dehydrogenase (NAD(P)+)
MLIPPPLELIAVAGAGSWGTTVAHLLASKGLAVTLWARESELAGAIPRDGENARYLPGVRLSPGLRTATDLRSATQDADLLVFAIPAQSLREVVRDAAPAVRPGTVVVNLAKGIEEGTGLRCSEIVAQELRQSHPVGVLAGPNIAWEIINGTPSKAVVACSSYRYLPALREVFSTPGFKVFECPDLAGAELGGAIKNVVALMAGVGDGLGYGVNTKAAVITRGLQEMVRLGVLMGGHRDTFFGLSGIGDLMATSLSPHSRNRTLGEHLGRGAGLAEAEAALHGRVAEGVRTSLALHEITTSFGLDMPVMGALHGILYEGVPARDGYLRIWSSEGRFEGD